MKYVKPMMVMALTSLICMSSASAGNREGHGGRVWDCKDVNDPHHMKLLDYALVEDEKVFNVGALDLGPGKTEGEMINYVMDRLARVEPDRARVFRERALGFMNRAEPWGDEQYINVNDVKMPLLKPENCELKQVVFQNEGDPRFADQPNIKFRYVQKLWDAMSAKQHVGIILHEIAYEDAIAQGAQYADGAMLLNVNLAAAKNDHVALKDWVAMLASAELGIHYKGMHLAAKTIQLSPQGIITQGCVLIPTLPGENLFTVNGVQATASNGAAAYFYADGVLAGANLLEPIHIKVDGIPVTIESYIQLYHDGSIGFGSIVDPVVLTVHGGEITIRRVFNVSESGKFMYVMSDDWNTSLTINGVVYKFGRDFILDADRNVRSATVEEEVKTTRTDGSDYIYREFEPIAFNAHGDARANGIFSGNSTVSMFIQITPTDDGLGFQYCSLNDSVPCTQIGTKPSYAIEELKSHLKLTAETYIRWNKGDSGRSTGLKIGGGGVLAGLGGIVFGNATSHNIAGAAISGAGILSEIVGLYGVAPLIDRYEARTATQRTVDRILNEHFLDTHMEIGQFKKELEASLATIP